MKIHLPPGKGSLATTLAFAFALRLRIRSSTNLNKCTRYSQVHLFTYVALAFLTLPACPPPSKKPAPDAAKQNGAVTPRPCPRNAPALPVLPFQRPEHDLAAFWLSRVEEPAAGAVLLDREQIAAHNRRILSMEKDGYPVGRFDLLTFRRTAPQVQAAMERRLGAFKEVIQSGKWVSPDGTRADAVLQEVAARMTSLKLTRELRVAQRSVDLRCFPTARPLYEEPWDEAFDMVQCSRVRMGEPALVLGTAPGFAYVFTPYAEGWIDAAALTPPLSDEQAKAYLASEDFVVIQADRLPVWSSLEGGALLGMVRLGLRLPLQAEPAVPGGRLRVVLPTPSGLSQGWIDDGPGLTRGYPAFTRQAIFSRALSLLGTPYGWGGMGGTRDCSRLMMDLFGGFGLFLPRNSWMQSRAGVRQQDVSTLDDQAKARAIEDAARGAVVLLYMKGHIMLYVGRDGDHLYAMHLFSGYLRPCPGGGETMMRANRALVSSLELGRGSSRKAFIERISTLVLLGGEAAAEEATP